MLASLRGMDAINRRPSAECNCSHPVIAWAVVGEHLPLGLVYFSVWMPPGRTREPRAAAHTANLSARERSMQYPLQCYEDNGKLFCSACEKVLDHTRKSTIESHFRSMKHQNALKRSKDLEAPQVLLPKSVSR
ncbi:CGG triplet repeat-binding protein 1-like [Penaeus vannamei]|uniref:CGG triplet repeat-binding protein 1-like n=1 Tax=Penaeus vannamei TaxID=6689 RepID=UPI00387F6D7C